MNTSLMIEILGWVGSVLLVVSLAQPHIKRLHSLNNVAAVLLVAYNAFIGAGSGIALNIGVIAVNVWRLVRLHHSELPEMPMLPANAGALLQTTWRGDSASFDQIKEHHRVVYEDHNVTPIVPKGTDTSGWLTVHGWQALDVLPVADGTPLTRAVDA